MGPCDQNIQLSVGQYNGFLWYMRFFECLQLFECRKLGPNFGGNTHFSYSYKHFFYKNTFIFRCRPMLMGLHADRRRAMTSQRISDFCDNKSMPTRRNVRDAFSS